MPTWLGVLEALFHDKHFTDSRPTVFLGTLPFSDTEYKIGLVVDSNPSFHVLMLLTIFVQIILLQCFSIVIWYGVIRQASRARAIVCGLGLIIPMSFVLPIVILNYWDVRNTSVRFGFILLPLMIPFKCCEAMFGSHNKVADLHRQSLTAYRYYAGFPQLPIVNEKGVVPFKSPDLVLVIKQGFFWLFVTSVIYSILEPYNFRPFPHDTTLDDSFLPTLHPGRMYNSFTQCCLFFTTLIFAMKTTGLLCMLTSGYHAVDHFVFDRQPLWCSTSPRDFWGSRWNTLIHHHLKVGVYKPVRKFGWSTMVATLATFLASALIHEFISYVQFFRTDAQILEDAPYYAAGAWGKHLVFFGWNALLILLQDVVQKHVPQLERWTESWPGWLKSHLVILLSMPVGHCFMDDITDGGYFRHLRPVIPVIVVKAMTNAA